MLRTLLVVAGLVIVGAKSMVSAVDEGRRVRDPLGYSLSVPQLFYSASKEQLAEANEQLRARRIPAKLRSLFGYLPMPSIPFLIGTKAHIEKTKTPSAWSPPSVLVVEHEPPTGPSMTFEELVSWCRSSSLEGCMAMCEMVRAENPEARIPTIAYAHEPTMRVDQDRRIIRTVGGLKVNGASVHAESWAFVASGQPVSVYVMMPAAKKREFDERMTAMYESLVVDPEESMRPLFLSLVASVLGIGAVGILISKMRRSSVRRKSV